MRYKILWDFEIKTDHPIQRRRLDFILINQKKKTSHLMDFAIPTDFFVGWGLWHINPYRLFKAKSC